MSNLIDAVIIDTSALEVKQFDFLGITSETIPAFYDLLHQKNMILLSHPILMAEIKKHINTSEIIKRSEELQRDIIRNRGTLELAGLSPDDAVDRIKSLSLKEKITSAFEKRYQDAVILSFPSPEKVFEDYFAAKPPFTASGKKKSEFPDAFVLGAVKEYIKTHSTKTVLVISSDDDWKSAVSEIDRISFARSIEEGIKTIQSAEGIMSSFYAAEKSIKAEIVQVAEGECFDLKGYEPIDDIEVTAIRVSSLYDDIVPLRVTQTDALIKCSAELSVDGSVTIIDEDRSFYDPESNTMLFTAFSTADFKNAPAEIECEIKLLFDPDNLAGTVQIEKVKIDYRYSIELDLDQAEVEWHSFSSEDEANAEMMDTLEEFFRH